MKQTILALTALLLAPLAALHAAVAPKPAVAAGEVPSQAEKGNPPHPPAQPAHGPGGEDYAHRQMKSEVFGEGDTEFWIFEPAAPVSSSSPLVVFLHGWAAMDPTPTAHGLSIWCGEETSSFIPVTKQR